MLDIRDIDKKFWSAVSEEREIYDANKKAFQEELVRLIFK